MKNSFVLVAMLLLSNAVWAQENKIAPKASRHSPLFLLDLEGKHDASLLDFTDLTVTHDLGPGSSETFEQQVFVSKTFAANASSPVIFYLSGEWGLSHAEVDRIVGTLARELKAYVVAAEHRFYGKSQPARPNGLSKEDLKYLTTDLALEDLAAAQRRVTHDFGLQGKWFAYGISYAATLATYYRLAHPELATGAVAFSAPLRVTPEGFDTYEAVAVNAFGPELTARVRRAHAFLMEKTTHPESRAWLKENFGLPTDDFTADDISSILVMATPQFAQSGRIPALKAALAQASTDADLAVALVGALKKLLGDDFWEESPYGAKNDPKVKNEINRWSFQSFTDYGWLYVSSVDPAQSFMPAPTHMRFLVDEYGKAFGPAYSSLMFDLSARMVDKLKTTATHVILANGSFDPWSSISYADLDDPARDIVPVVTIGGRHGAGAGPLVTDPNDPVYPAQQRILKVLRSWL